MSVGNVMQEMLSTLDTQFPLKAVSVGKWAKVKANGMNFTIRQYEAEGLGNVSVMEAVGFFGLMKMDTLIINPVKKDLPLFSYDRILAMGNDTLIIELYDTLLGTWRAERVQQVKEAYNMLSERDPGEHWYDSIKLAESVSKKGKKAQTSEFDKMTSEYFAAYLASIPVTDVDDTATKNAKASVYVEGLLTNGGPSTDVFKKQFGEEKTAYLFRNILFGTGEK